MKIKVKRLLAVLCGIVMLCNSGMGMVAHAQEDGETLILSAYQELTGENIGHGINDIPDNSGVRAAMLTNCSLSITVDANGVKGSMTTGSTIEASEIGVENVKVEKYVNGKWEQIGPTNSGHTTKSDYYAANVSTSSAEKGVEYRISCTHYAILNGVRHSLPNVTDGVKYTKP